MTRIIEISSFVGGRNNVGGSSSQHCPMGYDPLCVSGSGRTVFRILLAEKPLSKAGATPGDGASLTGEDLFPRNGGQSSRGRSITFANRRRQSAALGITCQKAETLTGN
jgi:hypothetical protein